MEFEMENVNSGTKMSPQMHTAEDNLRTRLKKEAAAAEAESMPGPVLALLNSEGGVIA